MPTQLIRGLHNISARQKQGIITIGNFDGVHLGHQALINQVKTVAKHFNAPSIVMTFEPHPAEFFAHGNPIPRITSLREKYDQIARLGVDFLIICEFNQTVADIPAQAFVEQILVDTLQIRHVIVGDDFRFGAGRAGDIQLLKTMGETYGFAVESLSAIKQDATRISSTSIRQALAQGDLHRAQTLLGRPYTMTGRIISGDQRGRKMGFPTANIFLQRKTSSMQGVFTVLMHGIQQKPLPGVANLGVRPTVDGTHTLLEVHLLNFNQNINDEIVCVEFCEKLRNEIRFNHLDLLIQQIRQDVEQAKKYFEKQGLL